MTKLSERNPGALRRRAAWWLAAALAFVVMGLVVNLITWRRHPTEPLFLLAFVVCHGHSQYLKGLAHGKHVVLNALVSRARARPDYSGPAVDDGDGT